MSSSNKLTFLGTGTSQGIPVIACPCYVCKSENQKDKRTRTSVMLTIQRHNLVIDSGPDFRQQMLREDVTSLSGILFTHEHKDHIAGLDDIRAYNYVSKEAMKIWCTNQVFIALQREYHYVFDGTDYPGIPQVDVEFIDQAPFHFYGVDILPVDVLHYQLPVKAFRIGKLSYITDANYMSDEAFKKFAGTEILIINALRKEKHISHFTLEEALEVIKKINPKQAYLTHLSHQMGLHDEVSKELPSNVHIAYDGLQIEF
ncbi:MAG: MBL fold metallo-hydrolase [Crocinitomicaceae bacterium]|nr:MBL fold metallo-hydrolase [Crocinitomicaceae bacterium]MBK8924858.1 MBL fold metallo-hydrolase [Crocinitomicaceae bacterium]